jgi:TolB protein
MHADGSHVKQLTHIKAKNYEPTYSPNGKLIAFESKRSGSENVWMMNSSGGNLRRITKKYGLDPAFSPDGKLIAFDDRKIFTIHTNGSHQHALTHTSLPMADEFPHFGLIK